MNASNSVANCHYITRHLYTYLDYPQLGSEVDIDLVFGDTDKERLRNRHWDLVSSIGW